MQKAHAQVPLPEQTPPLAGGDALRGGGGGLSVGRTSFDSVHRLKSGSWARPTAYWTAREQRGPWANHMAARETVDTGRRPVLGSAALTPDSLGHGLGKAAGSGRHLHRAGQHRGYQVL